MICQITALPRSGTAFIATMMNLAPNCLAFHELFCDGPHWKSKIIRHSDTLDGHIVCDVGTYQYLPKATIEDSSKVYIRQHPERSRRRAEKAFGYSISEADVKAVSDAAERWVEKYQPLVIEQSELFCLSSLERIWRYCNPTEPFQKEKVELLLQMNVQRMNPEKVFSEEAMIGREGELWGS